MHGLDIANNVGGSLDLGYRRGAGRTADPVAAVPAGWAALVVRIGGSYGSIVGPTLVGSGGFTLAFDTTQLVPAGGCAHRRFSMVLPIQTASAGSQQAPQPIHVISCCEPRAVPAGSTSGCIPAAIGPTSVPGLSVAP